jgi:flagellar basal body rod protein FlgG
MDGIELMATAMHAAKARLDVSAANLANVSTDGFHKRVARAMLGPAEQTATRRRSVPVRSCATTRAGSWTSADGCS